MKAKLKKRFGSLVVPYLIWNIIWMLFYVVIYLSPSLSSHMNQDGFSPTFDNILLGLFYRKYNPVFWFIFDLIVFVYLSPLLYPIIKRKFMGLILILIVTISSEILPEIYVVLRGGSSLAFFLIGAYIGCHAFETSKLAFPLHLKAIMLLGFALIMFLVSYHYLPSSLVVAFRALACLLLYYALPTASLPSWVGGLSMFIYAFHYNIAIVFGKYAKTLNINALQGGGG